MLSTGIHLDFYFDMYQTLTDQTSHKKFLKTATKIYTKTSHIPVRLYVSVCHYKVVPQV